MPASAVPMMAGVVSLVEPPPLVTFGAVGAVVSTSKLTGAEAGPVLPAASVSRTAKVCAPGPTGLVGLTVKEPVWSAAAVPMMAPFSRRVTVVPASRRAVNGRRGVVRRTAKRRDNRRGWCRCIDREADRGRGGADIPAASVSRTVKVCAPWPSAVVGLTEKAPVEVDQGCSDGGAVFEKRHRRAGFRRSADGWRRVVRRTSASRQDGSAGRRRVNRDHDGRRRRGRHYR